MKLFACCVLVLALLVALPAAAQTPIKDLDTPQFAVGTLERDGAQVPAGTVQLVPGHTGQANQFTFVADAHNGFFTTTLKPTPEWDRAAGLSFWVKGDGSSSWGGVEVIADDDFTKRYAFCFPVDSTAWRKLAVPWSDLIPETGTAPAISPTGTVKPSSLRYLWFGKWYYWRDYPAESYAVDELVLEASIPVDQTDYTPSRRGTPRLHARLETKEPVTLVTVGDSLSDKRHWANREVLWSEVLVKSLEQQYGGKVTLVNPAIGGTQLTHGLIVAPRWLKDHPAPDLITLWYGYNDHDNGTTPELFKERLRFAVDYLRRLTKGKSEIVLLTTAPAVGRWTEMEGLAQAARDVAKEKRTGLADVAAAFHHVGDQDETAKQGLFCRDEVHLGPAGHALAAEVVARALAGPPAGSPRH